MDKILSLLSASHSVFHVVSLMERELMNAGFTELYEREPYKISKGGKYYVKRNNSSIIAFVIPEEPGNGFRIVSTHNDSPTFALKPKPIYVRDGVTSLNVEPYGGAIYYSFLDRPLSLAGRVFYRVGEELREALVDIDEDLLVIPSLAIHQNREVNKGYEFNPAKDLVPLWMDESYDGDFASYLKTKCNIDGDILSHDLFLYVREQPRLVGEKKDLLLCPRLDDLSSAYASLLAFLDNKDKSKGDIAVFASFDNEEVGSLTAQGAMSDFLKVTLRRLCACLGYGENGYHAAIASSYLLSVDNAHANHPNHPDKADPTSPVHLNGGIVLKYNAEQRYTTSGASAAYVKSLARELGQPIQEFTNRSDTRGGSTLGNLSNSEVSILSADIGIAQLAMHSSVELCGYNDLKRMVDLLKLHYSI